MLSGPEFTRRMISALEKDYAEQMHNLLLAKDWPDFCDRRGQVKAVKRLLEEAHAIIKDMEN